MRSLDAGKRIRTGAMGVILVLLIIGVGQSFASVPMLFAQPVYYAQFSDSAGIKPGDSVQVAGVKVGKVRSLAIERDHILVGFTLSDMTVGTDSRASIRTDTILGRKNIRVEPRGSERLRASGVLPVSQTATPYQIIDAFGDLAKTAAGIDYDVVRRSLSVLSETIDQTYPNLSPALDGVARFSDTIGKRDEELRHLLANANKVAGVLGDRSGQINQLLLNARTLIAAVNERGQAITYLLENVTQFSTQVAGVFRDNPNINRVLEQLKVLSGILVNKKNELVDVLTSLGSYTASIGETITSGPYFKAQVVNLLPYQLLQPFLDAAFAKRGIDPENFFRSAGLPAAQFPDPNGTRFPNGAPPPAPTILEGTPEFPNPGVPKGSPCSYTPAADAIPSPGNPLPCAGVTTGPFGNNPYGPNYDGPNVVSLPPNPNAVPAPGVPSASLPGEPSPDAPGAAVPLPPAPPGARRPGGINTEFGPPPPALIGPPPPPGPGPLVPPPGVPPFPGNPPFIPPDSGGA